MQKEGFIYLDSSALAAFDLLDESIYIQSFATQLIIWANQAAVEFLGSSTAQELYKRALDPLDQVTPGRLEIILSAFRRGEVTTESLAFLTKDGTASMITRCRSVSVDGHPEAMLVELQPLGPESMPVADIRAIEFLRHTPTVVSLLALDGKVLLQNAAALEFFARISPEGLSGLNGIRMLFPYPKDFEDMLGEAELFGISQRTVQIVGQVGTVHAIQMKRIIDPGTGDPSLLVIQHDVSRLHDMSGQLAASEAALDVVLGLSPVPSLLISSSGDRLLRANFAASKVFNLESSDIGLAPDFLAELAEADLWALFLEETNAKGSCSKSMHLTSRAGRKFYSAVSWTKLAFEKGEAILVIVQDIDQQHQLAVELEAALNYHRGVSEMHRSLLEIATHEFRTPLAVIDGAAQRLARKADEFTPEMLAETAARIRLFVGRLSDLLDSTIERARSNLSEVPSTRKPGFIQDTIKEVSLWFSERAQIEIAEEIRGLPKVWFEKPEIERALMNLIANAVKYSGNSPRIEITGEERDDQVRIFIRDYGIGILPEQRELVFSERVRGTNVGNSPGHGLGLYIVRAIFRSHGGDAKVVDTPGPGATILLTLPLRRG